MKLRLNKYWTRKLLEYPETGMGYQKVKIKLKSGQTVENLIVLNAEDLELPDQYSKLKVEEIADIQFIKIKPR